MVKGTLQITGRRRASQVSDGEVAGRVRTSRSRPLEPFEIISTAGFAPVITHTLNGDHCMCLPLWVRGFPRLEP